MSSGIWTLCETKPQRILYANLGKPCCPCVVYRVHNDGPAAVMVGSGIHLDPGEDGDASGPKIAVALTKKPVLCPPGKEIQQYAKGTYDLICCCSSGCCCDKGSSQTTKAATNAKVEIGDGATVFDTATSTKAPIWRIEVPQGPPALPLKLNAGGTRADVNEVMLRVTADPAIVRQRLSVSTMLISPPFDQQWQMIFGGTFLNAFQNMVTDANGVLTLILGRNQIYGAVWTPPGGPEPGQPEGRMSFSVQAGSTVIFEIDLART